jgi:hypothetical protein
MNCLRPLEHWDRGFESYSRHGYLCVCLFCVCAVLCLGRGLATGWSPVQGLLPTVYRIKELKKTAKREWESVYIEMWRFTIHIALSCIIWQSISRITEVFPFRRGSGVTSGPRNRGILSHAPWSTRIVSVEWNQPGCPPSGVAWPLKCTHFDMDRADMPCQWR